MTTVLTYGTFDVLHYGHIRIFERARALGDRLIVGVSTDAFTRKKGKEPYLSFDDRCRLVRSLRFVDDVFPEECWEQKRGDILRYQAGIFVMGEDWTGKFDHLAELCQVIYLPRTEVVSSTLLRAMIAKS